MQLESPNLTQKCSTMGSSTITMGPSNHLFWGRKVKGQDHKAKKTEKSLC